MYIKLTKCLSNVCVTVQIYDLIWLMDNLKDIFFQKVGVAPKKTNTEARSHRGIILNINKIKNLRVLCDSVFKSVLRHSPARHLVNYFLFLRIISDEMLSYNHQGCRSWQDFRHDIPFCAVRFLRPGILFQ